ncbi:MAG TPA: L,D-transpeptidase family protein [Gaiellales bacterium]|nr:L,D-transpeptidase family protein [Gaiellales bacterium]
MRGWPRRAPVRVALLAGAAVVAAAAIGYAAYAYSTTARLGAVSPAAGAQVARPAPVIAVRVSHAARLGRYRLTIDGADMTTESMLAGGAIRLSGVRLGNGRHTVSLRASSAGMFGGPLTRTWSFTVDTRPPPLHLRPLPRGWVRSRTIELAGHTQPGVRVSAVADIATAHVAAGADGAFTLPLGLSDGRIPIAVTATDPAGNRRTVRTRLRVDATAPRVELGVKPVVHTNRPKLAVEVADTAPTRVSVTLDGARVRAGTRPGSPLAEGRHILDVTARDAAGNRTATQLRFVVDSTEWLGTATLVKGARGRDVRALQHLLRHQGFLHSRPTGVLGPGTVVAVRAFQRANALTVDGAVGPYTIGALSGRIVIDQSSHMLTLYRYGKPSVSFPVAVGQPAYPTPDGHFFIISKVENPTWVPPPDAPWAQGAVPIPPGPGNPLGTRWMGLSAPGVGIHGTDDPASIGYSVSHGCIRMQIPDAERLFSMVSIGMSVVIQQ